jgi:hypothetical protein
VVTASRECKAGFTEHTAYTIVTIQGARIPVLVAHCCGRDLTVLAADGTFSSGVNRSKLLWTLLSRHSLRLYLDFSPAFFSSFGSFDVPYLETDDEYITYAPEPDFGLQVVSANIHLGVAVSTFTPVVVSWVSPTCIRFSNRTRTIERYLPFALPRFDSFIAVDPVNLPALFGRLSIDVVRIGPPGGF